MYEFLWMNNYRKLRNNFCPSCQTNLYRTEDTNVRLCMYCDWVEPDADRAKRLGIEGT